MVYHPDWWLPITYKATEPVRRELTREYRPAWWLAPCEEDAEHAEEVEDGELTRTPRPRTGELRAPPVSRPERIGPWIAFFHAMDAAYARAAAERGEPYTPFTPEDLLAIARVAATMGVAPDPSAARLPAWTALLGAEGRREAMAGCA